MVKVVWFLKKADHLSMDEFRRWWLSEHALKGVEKQGEKFGQDALPGSAISNKKFIFEISAE